MCFKKFGIEIRGIWAIIIVVLLLMTVIIGWFYWSEWQPVKIRKECFNQADKQKKAVIESENILLSGGFLLTKRADYDKIFDDVYQQCILKNGLTK